MSKINPKLLTMSSERKCNYAKKWLCGCTVIMMIIIIILSFVISYGGGGGKLSCMLAFRPIIDSHLYEECL